MWFGRNKLVALDLSMTCISDELSSDESQCRPVTVRSGRLIEVGGRNALETFSEASMATDHALAKRLRELVALRRPRHRENRAAHLLMPPFR
jgi:hypothetical protein